MGNYLLMWNHMGAHVINYLVIILWGITWVIIF
jgi:hypothetical protein